MEHQENELIHKVEQYVSRYLQEHFSEEYVFHNLEHIRNVVDAVGAIAAGYPLTPAEFEILQLAAWFHDVGYGEGPKGHEERSATIAKAFLEKENYDKVNLQKVEQAILCTKRNEKPITVIDQILCDA
ncbi:MAG: HD domain-containing protein, partial [Chloroflexia bacterium]|nr:HD domain-containing protein [Chloroflexia bacterium]